ncbi:MAG TPA: RsmE family RNA methyltransferase [Polyangiaceae bacterium]|nr:RsmE family RNA methyltransferase [Polyangiaceae bacterium]
MARRIRICLENLVPGERVLGADASHYVAHVQRLREGDELVVFDPAACLEASATVLEIAHKRVHCELGEPRPGKRSELDVSLLQCMGKGDKIDDVVRASTALGVSSVSLCESARGVLKLGERAPARLERLHSIALSAAQQSGRGDLPTIDGPHELRRLLADWNDRDALKLCLDPRAEESYGAALTRASGRHVALLIGPEGGLSEDELELASNAGFTLVSFGAFVLRTELAGIAALGALISHRQVG